MIIAPIPASEPFRLLDLESYDIMDSQAEDEFDELVELAVQICQCPMSFISLLDKDRQWFKAKLGLAETQTSRDIAFCSHAILQDEVFVVEDATKDERFQDNPFVTGDTMVRFYAGAPIISTAGHNLGTICIVDTKPKKLSASQERALVILSNQVTQLLELRKKNLLIRERAEEIINLKSKAISTVLQAQEDEKKVIATNLHEDFAQGIASSIFYLQTAENDRAQSVTLVKKAKTQLQDILINMQSLSYSITPHVIDLLPPVELVKEYTEKIAATFPFTIQLITSGNKNNGTADNAINTIRIIEQWLKVLGEKRDIKKVVINLRTNHKFSFSIEDDGHSFGNDIFEQKIYNSMVYERANACGGSIQLAISTEGKNLLNVSLPFVPVRLAV